MTIKLQLTIILICSLSLSVFGQAKITAGEITYEWLSDSTYRINFNAYLDCSGASEPTTIPLCVTNTCNTVMVNLALNKMSGVNTTPSCVTNPNQCDQPTSTIPGIKKWTYSQILTLPYRCSSWKFSTSYSQIVSATNLTNQNTAYFETTFDNTGNNQGNSSPIFTTNAFKSCCRFQPTTYNNGATDVNGDSLSIEIVTPKTGSCSSSSDVTLIPATPILSIPNNPFQTNNTFICNATTGQISFNSSGLDNNIITVKIKEYRNGNMIGYILRNVCYNMIGCNVTFPAITIPLSLTGAEIGPGGRIDACVGIKFEFSFDCKLSGKNKMLFVSDNHSQSMPGASVSYTNQGTDSVRGHFLWAPSAQDGGSYTFTILVKDSSCTSDIAFYTSTSILINIKDKVATIGNDTSICRGNFVQLTGAGKWNVLGSGDITSLSCSDCSNPIVRPYNTTTYVFSLGTCPLIKDTINVKVNTIFTRPTIYITASPSNIVVPGMPVTFTAISRRCTDPTYVWRNNGINLPFTNDSIYTEDFYLHDKDIITCMLKCKDLCPIPAEPESNPIVLSMNKTGVELTRGKVNFSIYPNPNNGSFTLNGLAGTTDPANLDIINSIGQIVYHDIIKPVNHGINTQLNLQLPQGIYILKLDNQTIQFTVSN